MDHMSMIISGNIRSIRKEQKISLDTLSLMTGVSKSMLGQIERGESSPTIATLWKIATGLHISFTALTEDRRKKAEIIRNSNINPLLNDNGLFRLYPVFPFEDSKGFEMLFIEMDEGACSPSLPHEPGTEEYVIVYEGILSVEVGEEEYLVEAENSIRYLADREHCYKNAFKGRTRICMLIYYNK